MTNTSALLAAVLALAAPAFAGDALIALPPGHSVMMPVQLGVSARMIFVSKEPLRDSQDLILLADERARPLLAVGGKAMLDLLGGGAFTLDHAFHDAAVTDSGVILLATDEALGTVGEPAGAGSSTRRFLPGMALPYKGMRVFAGAGDVLYAVGQNPADGRTELFMSQAAEGGKKTFVKLLALEDDITAVAGDGRSTFFASGSLIAKIGPAQKKMERVLRLDGDRVRELEYSPKAGLFYASETGVAYAGAKKPLVLVSGPGLSIRLRKDSLLVLFRDQQDVMEFAGVSGLSKLLGKR